MKEFYKRRVSLNSLLVLCSLSFFINGAAFAHDTQDKYECYIEHIKLGSKSYKEGKLKEAEDYYKVPADKGNMLAQYQLGMLYKEQKKRTEAQIYLKLAADQGDVDAQYNLGHVYLDQDLIKDAFFYWKFACQQGHVGACYELGNLALSQAHIDEAEGYYKKAAHEGHKLSQYMLVRLYFKQGRFYEVKEYLKLFSDKSHLDAFLNFNCEKLHPYFQQEDEAFYKFVVDQGYVEAYYKLGTFYQERGRSSHSQSDSDLKQAIHYLKVAAEQDHLNAQSALAQLLFSGAHNQKETFEHYAKLAAQKGDVASMLLLAKFYSRSENIEDFYQAEHFCKLACSTALKECRQCLRNLNLEASMMGNYKATGEYLHNPTPEHIDLAKKFYQFAADRGDEKSKFRLAELLEIQSYHSTFQSSLEKYWSYVKDRLHLDPRVKFSLCAAFATFLTGYLLGRLEQINGHPRRINRLIMRIRQTTITRTVGLLPARGALGN